MSATLEAIERRDPEWHPWLAVVREVLAAIDDREWDAAVPQRLAPREEGAPLLAGVPLRIEGRARDQLLQKLGHLEENAVAALLPVPLLHACRRRFAAEMPHAWSQGYCPLCGGWPTLAEVCGVERARYLRCASCGSAWQMHGLSCPYCGIADHGKLGSLVPQQPGAKGVIEVCHACQGYLKVFTGLRPAPPAQVMLDDLASVELDLAAAGHGYRRPAGTRYGLEITRS